MVLESEYVALPMDAAMVLNSALPMDAAMVLHAALPMDAAMVLHEVSVSQYQTTHPWNHRRPLRRHQPSTYRHQKSESK
jgi:hypothetical protein